jgi:hypothetical protein
MLIGNTWITVLILVHAMMQGITCTLAHCPICRSPAATRRIQMNERNLGVTAK